MDLLERDRLDRLSHELLDAAGQLRLAVVGVRSHAAAMSWRSPAANACARSLELLLAGALRLAENVDDSAATAGGHGRRAYRLAGQAATAGVSLAGRGVHLAERLVGR